MRRLLSLMLLLAVPAAAAGQVVHDDGVAPSSWACGWLR
jgi:hypothetical protein